MGRRIRVEGALGHRWVVSVGDIRCVDTGASTSSNSSTPAACEAADTRDIEPPCRQPFAKTG